MGQKRNGNRFSFAPYGMYGTEIKGERLCSQMVNTANSSYEGLIEFPKAEGTEVIKTRGLAAMFVTEHWH